MKGRTVHMGSPMTSISSDAALLILQAQPSAATDKTKAAAPDLLAIANGQPAKQTVSATAQPTKSQSNISDALFSVNNRSITQMKLDLIDRTGEAGVKKDDYASTDDFVAAMKKVVTNIKAHEGWEQVIAKIEKDLGLDKLGVSLEDVINSARDPEKDDKVTEALKKQAGMIDEKEDDADKAVLLKQDEDGTYAPTDAAPQN